MGAATGRLAGHAGALLLGLLMLWAGVSKLLALDDFTLAVWNFRILGWQASVVVARVLPWLEIALGLWLLVPLWRRLSLALVGLLLAGFTGALIHAGLRGLDISCGCFGGAGEAAGGGGGLWPAVARNLARLLGALLSMVASRRGGGHPRGGNE